MAVEIFGVIFGLVFWLVRDGLRTSAETDELSQLHLTSNVDALARAGFEYAEKTSDLHVFRGAVGELPFRLELSRFHRPGHPGVRLILHIAPAVGLRVANYVGISHDPEAAPALRVASAREAARDQGISRADTSALSDEVMAQVASLLNRWGGTLSLTPKGLEWQKTVSIKTKPGAIAPEPEVLVADAVSIARALSASR
jgi:hypothetical protein